MTTYVKYFDDSQTGAPSLTGTTGSMIALLDAVLINGFNLKTLDSLTVSNNVATCTVNAGHNFKAGDGRIITIAGCTGSWTGLNAEQTVLSVVSASQFTFLAPGISNGTATGTITAKVSPVGWTAPYSGTNLKAYKSSSVSGSGCLLRVDDTDAYAARVIGCETMTDINTWSAKFPTEAQLAGGLWWLKQYARTSSVNWLVVADSQMIHLTLNSTWYPAMYGVFTFGDFVPYSSNDVYKCMISGDVSYRQVPCTACGSVYIRNNQEGQYIERSYTGSGTSVTSSRTWLTTTTGYNTGYAYPSESGSMALVSPVALLQGTNIFRGNIPGIFYSIQSINGTVATKTIATDISGLSGSAVFSVISCATPVDSTTAYTAMFDLVGPWR